MTKSRRRSKMDVKLTTTITYLFPGRSFDRVKGGMLEPIAVVDVLMVEQLRERMNIFHLLEALLYKDGRVVGRHRARIFRRWTGSRFPGQLRHAIESLSAG